MVSGILHRNNINILGSGTRTVLFAHGFGTDQTVWHQQIELFAKTNRIVLFDHVGAGNSALNAYDARRYNTLFSFANDLIGVCTETASERITLVGHSVGGMIGLLASIAAPELFEKLILIGTSPRYLNDHNYYGGFEQDDLDQMYAAAQQNYAAWAGGFAPAAMGNPGRPELAEQFAASLASLRPDIALATMRVIFQLDHRPDLPKVRTPTWILQSPRDIAVPQSVGRYLQHRIAGSHYRELEAEGHFPHVSAPDAVNHAIQIALDTQ